MAIPWALSWFGDCAHGSCLFPDVLVSFQWSRKVGLWFLGRLFRASCKYGEGPWGLVETFLLAF